MDRRLEELAGDFGGAASYVLASSYGRAIGDPDEAEWEQMRVRVYLARYMSTSPDVVEHWEATKVADYAALLSECIKDEQPKPGGGVGPGGSGRR